MNREDAISSDTVVDTASSTGNNGSSCTAAPFSLHDHGCDPDVEGHEWVRGEEEVEQARSVRQ
jgi:hypothetical protein